VHALGNHLEFGFQTVIALAVARSMRLNGDSGDWGPGGEHLFSKFRSSLCL
jgi:hypothetical protein